MTKTTSTPIQRSARGKQQAQKLAQSRGFEPVPVQRSTLAGDREFGAEQVHPGVLRPSSGAPLPTAVQAKMEAAFGHDFANVRVHHGPEAESIGAVAFTRGTHLHFAPGRFQPHSAEGQRLLGHELAHVVQQRAGRVARPGGAVPINADPALEREADAAGARAAAGGRAQFPLQTPGQGLDPASANPVQRSVRGGIIQTMPFKAADGRLLDTDTLSEMQLEAHAKELESLSAATPSSSLWYDKQRNVVSSALLARKNGPVRQPVPVKPEDVVLSNLFGGDARKRRLVKKALAKAKNANLLNEAVNLSASQRVLSPNNLLHLLLSLGKDNPGYARELKYLHKHGVRKGRYVQTGSLRSDELAEGLRYRGLLSASKKIRKARLSTVGADAVVFRRGKPIKFVQHKTISSDSPAAVGSHVTKAAQQLGGQTGSGEYALGNSERVVHLTLQDESYEGPNNAKIQNLVDDVIPNALWQHPSTTNRPGYPPGHALSHHADVIKIETNTDKFRYRVKHGQGPGEGFLEEV